VIENLRKYYRKSCLKQHPSADVRMIKCIPVEKAKYIGILYEIGDENTYVWLSSYVNKLLAAGKTLRIVGYHNNKFVPHYCIPQLKYDFFCNKETNWFGKPTARFVQEFVDEPFDILLDLTVSPSFPLQYFLANSVAHFKIGAQQPGNAEFLDMMIKLEEDHSVADLMYFINDYTKRLNGE